MSAPRLMGTFAMFIYDSCTVFSKHSSPIVSLSWEYKIDPGSFREFFRPAGLGTQRKVSLIMNFPENIATGV